MFRSLDNVSKVKVLTLSWRDYPRMEEQGVHPWSQVSVQPG